MGSQQRWPVLEKDDEGLHAEIGRLLTERAVGDPYGEDGTFAANIAKLPLGLRAMAATHWLDVSLTLDCITWHFGNFGEPGLVAATEAGLRELDLQELADCFVEAKNVMMPLVAKLRENGDDYEQILEGAGLTDRADNVDRRASALNDAVPGESPIYKAWIRYARRYPERVFGPAPSGTSPTKT
jgi:hypothetical protein